MAPKRLALFGGDAPWRAADWTASDDRVRGGSSQSYLDIVPLSTKQPTADSKTTQARFHGTLDTSTLGGAGFASQRTTSVDTTWDLAAYAGIELVLGPAAAPHFPNGAATATAPKRYTFILKDTLLDREPETGREQATVSWEVDFVLPHAHSASSGAAGDAMSVSLRPTVLRLPWTAFKPTYRGREKKGAGKLDTAHIKRVSFMMRSFFDEQSGPFELFVEQVAAYTVDEREDGGGWLASLGRCLGWRL